MALDLASLFAQGFEYEPFLDRYATPPQREKWNAMHRDIELSPDQLQLLSSFTREMKVFVLAGAWCGDCVNQCPIFDHFATASPKIRVRYFDRDDCQVLSTELQTCGAARVPSVLFVSEDDFVCGRYGDRTLSRYREMAQSQLGPTCATGIPSRDRTALGVVIQEWLDEFERIQWMLRLSGRLRTKHGD
ncbi:MAG: thioredoxin family protein [Pirellulales bacterium]